MNKLILIIPIVFFIMMSVMFNHAFAQAGCYVEDFYFNWFIQDEFNRCIDNVSGGNSLILVEGNNTSITQNSTHATINSLITGNVAVRMGYLHNPVTKINIGTTYVDIYPCASFTDSVNCLFTVDCSRMREFQVFVAWDYVGTGNQQFRIVDFNNDVNVFYESPTFNTDQFYFNTQFNNEKPSWCVASNQPLQMQGKSTVASDDPAIYLLWINTR